MEENRRGAIRTISNRQEEDSFRTPLATLASTSPKRVKSLVTNQLF
jgi:hypothetical protein